MATNFDANVQPMQLQEYTNFYHPISQPEADVSGATRGKAIGGAIAEAGKAIETGLKVGDEATQMGITQSIHERSDPIREGQIQRLSSIDNILTGQTVDEANQTPAPQRLKELPQSLQDFYALRSNGKLSNTYVDMKMYNLAKDLRTQYPGYRDYIDNEFAKITGERPANALIKSLAGDINQAQANKDDIGKKIETQIIEGRAHGDVDNATWQKYMNKEISADQVLGVVSANRKARQSTEDDIKAINLRKDQRQDNQEQTQEGIVRNVWSTAAAKMNEWSVNVGKGNQHLGELIGGMASGTDMDSQHAQIAGQAIDQYKRWLSVNLRTQYMNSAAAAGPNGPKFVNDTIEQQLQSLDQIRDAFLSKDTGQVGAAARMLQSMISDRTLQWATAGNGVGSKLVDLKSLSDMSPNNAPWVAKVFGMIARTGFDPESISHIQNEYAKGIGQSSNPRFQAQGLTYTMDKSVDEIKNNSAGVQTAAKNINHLISNVTSVITDPGSPPEAKKNAVTYLYSNPDLMQKFQKGDGKDKVFSSMFNERATAEVLKLGGAAFNTYWQSASHSFGNLFQGELQELNEKANDPGVHWHWDQDNSRFDVKIDRGADSAALGNLTGVTQQAVNRINLHLWEMQSALKAAGQDPNKFIGQMLMQNGVNPRLINMDTVPGKMMEALRQGSIKKTVQ